MFQLNINGGGGVQFDSLIACSVRSLPVYYIHANKSRGIYKIEKKNQIFNSCLISFVIAFRLIHLNITGR